VDPPVALIVVPPQKNLRLIDLLTELETQPDRVTESETETHRQTDRERDRQRDRRTDRKRDRQTERVPDGSQCMTDLMDYSTDEQCEYVVDDLTHRKIHTRHLRSITNHNRTFSLIRSIVHMIRLVPFTQATE